MVKKVRGLEIKQEMVKVAKEVAEVAKEMVEVAKEVVEVANEMLEVAKEVTGAAKEVVEVVKKVIRIMNNSRGGCLYKEFMACSPKDYDEKGGAIVYTCWIEKIEPVQDMSGCRENQKVKYTASSFIDKELTWWNSQVQTRGRKAAFGMTWEDIKTSIREELCQNNEMKKLETKFGCYAMVGAGHVAYTNRFHKLSRLVPHLVTPENKRIRRYIYGLAPQIRTMVAATEPTIIQSVVQKAGMVTDEAIRNGTLKKITVKRGNNRESSRDGRLGMIIRGPRLKGCFPQSQTLLGRRHFAMDYKARPRMVTLVNTRNPTAAREACFECGGRGNNGNQACGKAFMMGAEEAHQDPNIMTGIKPSDLAFSYEIEIANGQLIEISKVIRDCKLEIEGHTFDIDLIPFGHGSFDVIVGMDWLIRHKAKIVCHKKVVRISLPHGKILRVLGEKCKEKVRYLMSAKTEEQKLKDIVVVRKFYEERIAMDFITKFPRTRSGHDAIWVIIGSLPKSTHFLPIREDFKMDRLKVVRDRQKIYADRRRKPLEFSVGDHVLLKVSPWKGMVRFRKKGKLAPGFVGPFKITERISPVAYRLSLPEELNRVHDTFYVLNLKKCLADPTL
nr:hypothetical protein [Tanacetum cinerariifolium]